MEAFLANMKQRNQRLTIYICWKVQMLKWYRQPDLFFMMPNTCQSAKRNRQKKAFSTVCLGGKNMKLERIHIIGWIVAIVITTFMRIKERRGEKKL